MRTFSIELSPNEVSGMLGQALSEAIEVGHWVPKPAFEVDFCEECRKIKKMEEARARGELVGWDEVSVHVCYNQIYNSGMLHLIIRNILCDALNKKSEE